MKQKSPTSLQQAWERRDSGVWIEGAGIVRRLLADDHDGSRHQRFVLQIHSDHSLLVAHNIDLAERIPLAMGDKVIFRGMYEWNDQGGLVHWTHDDPMGIEEGGFITYRRKRFR